MIIPYLNIKQTWGLWSRLFLWLCLSYYYFYLFIFNR